jgi:hypothetical protein
MSHMRYGRRRELSTQISNNFDDVVAVVGEREDLPCGINNFPFLLELADRGDVLRGAEPVNHGRSVSPDALFLDVSDLIAMQEGHDVLASAHAPSG